MPKFRNRKGAFIVVFGVMFTALVAVMAVAIDFSRIWTMRNELQTSADAAALAGAKQFSLKLDSISAKDSANTYALRNQAMQGNVTVDSTTPGVWDDDAATFTPGVASPNAMRVVVYRNTNNLIMRAFGVTAPRVKARAIAWAEAPVGSTSCMKPWGVPYQLLMAQINYFRFGVPPASQSDSMLQRPFDRVADMNALNAMSDAQRTFMLKWGGGDLTDTLSIPGNYQAVDLPVKYDYETNTDNYPFGKSNGAADYYKNISGETCNDVSVGDSLGLAGGATPEQTWRHVDKSQQPDPYGVCETVIDDNSGGATNGNCTNSSGGTGVDIKAAFFYCDPTARKSNKCSGTSSNVAVRLLGSFTLSKIYPNQKGSPTCSTCVKGDIEGIFKPVSDPGPVGGTGSSTLNRLILVK
jgi:Flp pilus assembly protein TadG